MGNVGYALFFEQIKKDLSRRAGRTPSNETTKDGSVGSMDGGEFTRNDTTAWTSLFPSLSPFGQFPLLLVYLFPLFFSFYQLQRYPICCVLALSDYTWEIYVYVYTVDKHFLLISSEDGREIEGRLFFSILPTYICPSFSPCLPALNSTEITLIDLTN
jgi:hypothetical protein